MVLFLNLCSTVSFSVSWGWCPTHWCSLLCRGRKGVFLKFRQSATSNWIEIVLILSILACVGTKLGHIKPECVWFQKRGIVSPQHPSFAPLQNKVLVISFIALILGQNRSFSLFLAKCANENSNTCKHHLVTIDLCASQKEEINKKNSYSSAKDYLTQGT